MAQARERVPRPEFFFWRTQAGAEIDLLIAEGRSLRQAMADLGCRKGWIVTGVGERLRAGPDLEIVPWSRVARGEIDFGLTSARR